MSKFQYTVTTEDAGIPVKGLLRQKFNFSSRLLTKLKFQHLVFLNGEETPGWITPKPGDVLSIKLPEEKSDFPVEDIPIYPVFEDDDLLILNKQYGVIVHPTKGHPYHTIANGLMKYMLDTDQSFKIRFVNRLDMDTSGLLIVAKNSHAQDDLTKQMKANRTEKRYFAIANGTIFEDEFTINLPIGRPDPERVERGVMSPLDGGYASVTHVKVLKRFPAASSKDSCKGCSHCEALGFDAKNTAECEGCDKRKLAFTDIEGTKVHGCEDGYTMIELLLETGRTHQIRVHMSHIGYPLVGDHLYGGDNPDLLDRQALHAYKLSFNHPVSGERLTIESPLPEDIQGVIEKFRSKSARRSLMQIYELILLAVGLSMDAFAVSVCKGLSVEKTEVKHMACAGLWFGGFQALMPLVGYFLGSAFIDYIENIDHWIAFILLGLIGLNMIKESRCHDDEDVSNSFGVKTMFVMAVATSIDALAVGITFAFLKVNVIFAVVTIGITTFLFSAAGIKIGSIFGSRFKSKAELAGGIILIFLGLKILAEHMLGL